VLKDVQCLSGRFLLCSKHKRSNNYESNSFGFMDHVVTDITESHLLMTVYLTLVSLVGGLVVDVVTQRSHIQFPPGSLLSNNLEHRASNLHQWSGAQANSAFHPYGVGKWTAISAW